MKILVLNAGSSSLKFLLIDITKNLTYAKGRVEINKNAESKVIAKINNKEIIKNCSVTNYIEALNCILDVLTDKKVGVIQNINEINAFGHRVVHGGKYTETVLITNEVISNLSKTDAPLHAASSIDCIKACITLMPKVPNVAVFDTTFHKTMPKYASLYAINKNDYEKFNIKKYGFHGTNHFYVSREYANITKQDINTLNIISCHLGNGSSVAAIQNGRSIDTSMGFTPLEGLVMGTRCGDIDPAVVEFLSRNKNISVSETIEYLNKQCGLLGLTNGFSFDMRDIEKHLNNPDCKLAFDMFVYRLKKYIGSYIAVLGKVDAIIFTGGIGENDSLVRAGAIDGLNNFGIKLDINLNSYKYNKPSKISKSDSNIEIYVIPANEELIIAEETLSLLKKQSN